MSSGPADHARRFHNYIRALSQVSDADECDLLSIVLGDADQVMAESAVIRHLDCKAAALGEGEPFTRWGRRIAPALHQHNLPARRLQEWSLLHAITAGRPWNAADLVEASNWLQRTVAERTGASEALIVLAERGRTKRVRNLARSRLA